MAELSANGFPPMWVDCSCVVSGDSDGIIGWDDVTDQPIYCEECDGAGNADNRDQTIAALIERVVALETRLAYAGIAPVERKTDGNDNNRPATSLAEVR